MAHTLDSTKRADIVIVGGGIIGSAIALRLARSGASVAVIDRGQPCSEASGAAAGMIAPQGEVIEPEPFSKLCTDSRDLYPEFVAEVEELSQEHVGYRRDGTLLVAIEENECEELEHVYRKQIALGLPLERLSNDHVLERFSGLSSQIELALFVKGDHWVNNERLTHALIRAGENSGVTFHWNCTVTGFKAQGDQVESVRVLPQGSAAEDIVSTGRVVLSAGCWSGQLAETLGVSLPIAPCHGEMIEFETPSDIPYVVRAGINYVVPRGPQGAVAGTTARWGSFEKAVTANGLHSIIQGLTRILPIAKDFKFRRAWAGLRPDTKDHLPVLGLGLMRNLIFATGHFRNGILLAPITAKLIAELVLTGASSHSLDLYSPSRFATLD
ncbi:MAG: glycine oxidase ThiO [Acidobacteria bacterium]|nr:MAG: glycine oxidase ThiO [Acidobacteriota bacterium]